MNSYTSRTTTTLFLLIFARTLKFHEIDRAVFREALFSQFQSKKGSRALKFYEKIVFIFAFLATSRKLILAKISENKVPGELGVMKGKIETWRD